MNKKQYLERVLQGIKSKDAKEFVKRELDNHLEASIRSLCASGMSREEAEKTATEKMGSAESLGVKMNKLHRPRVDWSIWGAAILLLIAGFFPLLTLEPDFPVSRMLFRKSVTIIGSVIVIIALMLFDYRKLEKRNWLFPVMAGTGVLLFPLLAKSYINGMPTIGLGRYLIGPTVLMPLLLLGWTILFQKYSRRLPVLFLIFIITLLVFIQGIVNLSVIFWYVTMVFIMYLWTIRKKKMLLVGSVLSVAIAAIGALALLLTTSNVYQKERWLGFLNPEAHSDGSGYIPLLIQKYIANASFIGSNGEAQLPGLPWAHTDFVFVNLLSAYGWIAGLVFFLLLAYLAVRMVWIAKEIHDPFGQLLIIGCTALFTVPFVYNIAMVFGLVPISGFYLPFLSYGTTPTLISAIVIGLVLSVYRRSHLIPKAGEAAE